MELKSLNSYATSLISDTLERDAPLNRPATRNRRAVIRASGWLKESNRTVFMAMFVHEEMDALRVNVRSDGNGCFHYPAIPKTEITPKNTSELAERIISDIKNHIESKMSPLGYIN
jgi:hypothetical protein